MKYLESIKDLTNQYKAGKIILQATDTIWGLQCDAFNEISYRKIFEIKNRTFDQKLILLVSSIEMLQKYVEIYPKIHNILEVHEKPLTIIYPNVVNLPDYLKSKDNSIAIRLVKEPILKEIIDTLDRPLASTSANISKDPFPENYASINRSIIDNCDFIQSPLLKDTAGVLPSVIAKLGDNEKELIFVRE